MLENLSDGLHETLAYVHRELFGGLVFASTIVAITMLIGFAISPDETSFGTFLKGVVENQYVQSVDQL